MGVVGFGMIIPTSVNKDTALGVTSADQGWENAMLINGTIAATQNQVYRY